jgi:glycosyltransferase involved in cell wall biosynthesis
MLPDPTFTIIAPVHNEEAVLLALYARVSAVMDSTGEPWELVLVDDGSQDTSAAFIRKLHEDDGRVRGLSFSRNFGFQAAVTAGLEMARGEAVILIDADLQDPPEVIPEMIAKWREGFDVVYGVRGEREGETLFKKATAAGFYRVIGKIASVRIPADTGDFRLMDRRVVEAIRRMPERHRFLRGMVSWAGYRQTGVVYKREPRFAGRTNFTAAKMVRFALDAITSFSYLPLQLAGYVGLLLAGAGVVGGLVLLVLALAGVGGISGWGAAVLVAVTVVGGTLMMFLGVLGEYLGRVAEESKGRPLYLVRERWDSEDRAKETEARSS